MKHISEFLTSKKQRLESTRTLAVFDAPHEKGSREWRTQSAVRGDVVHAYTVRAPKKAIVVAQKNHTLRIIYPPMRTVPET